MLVQVYRVCQGFPRTHLRTTSDVEPVGREGESVTATVGVPEDGRRESAKIARVERRRRQLLEAATKVMSETGYHAMSMQSLADQADVSVGLIYQYFGGKEEILRAVILDVLESFRDHVPTEVDAAGGDPVARLTAGIRAFCDIISAKRAAAMLAYRESKTLAREDLKRIEAMEHDTTAPIRRAIEDGVESGVFRPVDVELASHNVLMVAHGWALKHWNLAPRMTLDQYVAAETDLLLASLASRPEA